MPTPTPSRPRRSSRRPRLLALVALIPFLASCSGDATTPATETVDGLYPQLAAAQGAGGGGHTLEVSPTEAELWVDPAPPEEARELALDVTVMNRAMCVLPGRTARFTSSDESVATVDRDGVIRSVGVGEAVVTVHRGQLETTVDVVVDDGVRTPSGGLQISFAGSGSLFMGASAFLTFGQEASPFSSSPTGQTTVTMDGVTVLSGFEGPLGAIFNTWASIADFEAEFGLDLSPGVEHTLTFDYEGDTFYNPVTFTVQWSIDDGEARWINGVLQ